MMRALQKNLSGLLGSPRASKTSVKRPAVHRPSRDEAKALAKLHGIDIEAEDGTLVVWPSKAFARSGQVDPWEGDHSAQDWKEALVMVRVYSGVAKVSGVWAER